MINCQHRGSHRKKMRLQHPSLISCDVDRLDGCSFFPWLQTSDSSACQRPHSTWKAFALLVTPRQSDDKAPVFCLSYFFFCQVWLADSTLIRYLVGGKRMVPCFDKPGGWEGCSFLLCVRQSDTASLHFWLGFFAQPKPPLRGEGLVFLLRVACVWMRRLLS